MNKNIAFAITSLALSLTACGSAKIPGLSTGAVSKAEQKQASPPDDPVARAVKVGVTSAQAQKCGYYFDPQQLRASFLAVEAQRAMAPDLLKKVAVAHDFSRQKVTAAIAKTEDYCNSERTSQIKTALSRYLAGNFSIVKKQKSVEERGFFDVFGNEQKPDTFNPEAIHDPLLDDGKRR